MTVTAEHVKALVRRHMEGDDAGFYSVAMQLAARAAREGKNRFAQEFVAEGTLDDYVAALLEQKARTIGVLEAEAADNAGMVEAVVEAALTGERPDWTRTAVRSVERVASASAGSSMGLLGDMLDLMARAGRGLAAVESSEQVIEVPSKSKPGTFNRVRISMGVATCDCPGFSYRGDCSHARGAVTRLAG